MSTNVPEAPPGRPRPAPRSIVVRAVRHISPRMRRVTFGGPELATFAWSGPAAHLKLIFPEPGSDVAVAPLPDGPRPSNMRTYTPRRFDAQSQTLDVDFVLHGEGPASTWAAQARVGETLVMMGPAPGYAVVADAAWYVVAADDAALPALETLLAAIPASIPVTAFIEVPSAGEERDLGRANADLRWLVRDDREPAGVALAAALEAFAWPAGNGAVYVGCEALAMRRLRASILERSGLDRTRVTARGYWRAGAVNHPDHDYGDD